MEGSDVARGVEGGAVAGAEDEAAAPGPHEALEPGPRGGVAEPDVLDLPGGRRARAGARAGGGGAGAAVPLPDEGVHVPEARDRGRRVLHVGAAGHEGRQDLVDHARQRAPQPPRDPAPVERRQLPREVVEAPPRRHVQRDREHRVVVRHRVGVRVAVRAAVVRRARAGLCLCL